MSWSYDETLSSDRDWVRFRTGSTNSNDQGEISNEEIDAVLAIKPNRDLAALSVARAILAKYSRDYDRSNIGMSSSRSQRVNNLKEVIKEIEDEMRTGCEPGPPDIQSQAAKDGVNSDADFIQCPFIRDRHTNV